MDNSKSFYSSLLGKSSASINPLKTIYLFVDEFTNYLDFKEGNDTYNLLTHLNYEVKIVNHLESGRSLISKGFLRKAKDIANKNVDCFRENPFWCKDARTFDAEYEMIA